MTSVRFTWNHQWYELKPDQGIDISIGVGFADSVRAFGVGLPRRQPLQVDGFVGSVAMGGSCNCDEITFVPHCHATHTETVAHILSGEAVTIQPTFPLVQMTQLITVNSQYQGVTKDMLVQAHIHTEVETLVIRTLPNGPDKKNMHYTDQSSYVCPDAMDWLVAHGINHLLIDTPSVDPMADGGALAAHRAFWQRELKDIDAGQIAPTAARTLTELIYVPSQVKDGMYGLQFSVGNYELDAMPSRPTLFMTTPVKEQP